MVDAGWLDTVLGVMAHASPKAKTRGHPLTRSSHCYLMPGYWNVPPTLTASLSPAGGFGRPQRGQTVVDNCLLPTWRGLGGEDVI